MSIDSEIIDPKAELERRTKSLRETLETLSVTDKIRELGALQERYYELPRVLAALA